MRLYSYKKVWNVEKKIYSFQNIRLPVPVKPIELGYFAIFALIMVILAMMFPFLGKVPVVIRVVAIPFALMKFLVKKKLDGKMPQKFLIDYIKHLMTRLQVTEFFRKTERPKEEYKIKWRCSCRNIM